MKIWKISFKSVACFRTSMSVKASPIMVVRNLGILIGVDGGGTNFLIKYEFLQQWFPNTMSQNINVAK